MANSPVNSAGTHTDPGYPGDIDFAMASIRPMRQRIDEIDAVLIELWLERAALSQRIGMIRVASGGTRLALAREHEILERFRKALGADGAQLALLILRSGRGVL
jgi:chorismate mutase